ncbi:MAG TPA: inositol monophosphatase family protein [Gammaproteobacteria bacterium]|nr:inositol monophosphatase family protein [Gammaproteobacteria bacterium]
MRAMSMHPYLNIAITAARLAGKIITRHMDQLHKLTIFEKGVNDLVTMVDKSAEEAIIETIYKAYPNHSILGEESGHHPGNEFTWVIDPLDGTMNYVHGFPQFAVSIAVKLKDHLEHAVVYDPLSQDLYTASRGCGAHLNNRRIRVTDRADLNGALIGSDFPYHDRNAKPHGVPHLEILQEIFHKGSDVRRIGSAALSLAYVAAGKLDGFWESDLNPWDIAAGALIVREAGGFVSDFNGENGFLESGNIVAGTRKVHTELLQIIKK